MTLLLRAARLALGAAVLRDGDAGLLHGRQRDRSAAEHLLLPHRPRRVDRAATSSTPSTPTSTCSGTAGRCRATTSSRSGRTRRPSSRPTSRGRARRRRSIPFLQPTSWQPNCPSDPPPPTNDCRASACLSAGLRAARRLHAVRARLGHRRRVRDRPAAVRVPLRGSLCRLRAARHAPLRARVRQRHGHLGRRQPDDPNAAPPSNADVDGADPSTYPPVRGRLRRRASTAAAPTTTRRATTPTRSENTRNATMPGEPFGMAQSPGRHASMAVTSETDTRDVAADDGLRLRHDSPAIRRCSSCSMGCPTAASALAAVPHDPNAGVPLCEAGGRRSTPCVRQAFLQTNRQHREVDLLRYYDDDGTVRQPRAVSAAPTLYRPFLEKERAYTITANNARDRLARHRHRPDAAAAVRGRCDHAGGAHHLRAAARRASSSPTARRRRIVVGQIGQQSLQRRRHVRPRRSSSSPGNVSLRAARRSCTSRPSSSRRRRVHGHYELMLFVVCLRLERGLRLRPRRSRLSLRRNAPGAHHPTGAGPYAMAFDPFVARRTSRPAPTVPIDPDSPPDLALKRYRFAYVASFTHSYVQVIDLDADAAPRRS